MKACLPQNWGERGAVRGPGAGQTANDNKHRTPLTTSWTILEQHCSAAPLQKHTTRGRKQSTPEVQEPTPSPGVSEGKERVYEREGQRGWVCSLAIRPAY